MCSFTGHSKCKVPSVILTSVLECPALLLPQQPTSLLRKLLGQKQQSASNTYGAVSEQGQVPWDNFLKPLWVDQSFSTSIFEVLFAGRGWNRDRRRKKQRLQENSVDCDTGTAAAQCYMVILKWRVMGNMPWQSGNLQGIATRLSELHKLFSFSLRPKTIPTSVAGIPSCI